MILKPNLHNNLDICENANNFFYSNDTLKFSNITNQEITNITFSKINIR